MELDQLEAFIAIVRFGGFTRASATMHLSQPAISRRVHLLEHELGAPLFERIQSGVVLTDAGRAFLPHAEAVLASVQDGAQAVRALHAGDRGPVSLALVGTLTNSWVMQRLRQFRKEHPGVELSLRTALSSEVSALVRRGDATLGLRYRADPHAELSVTPIHDERMVAIASPDHPLPKSRRIASSRLARERWIAFPPPEGSVREPHATAVLQALSSCGVDTAAVVLIDSLTAQKRMVEAGFGLALVQRSSIEEELRAGTLRILNAPALSVSVPVVLVQRRRSYLSGAAAALASLLTAKATSRSRS